MRSNQVNLQKRYNSSFSEEDQRTKPRQMPSKFLRQQSDHRYFWKYLSAIIGNILTVDHEKRKPYWFSERGLCELRGLNYSEFFRASRTLLKNGRRQIWSIVWRNRLSTSVLKKRKYRRGVPRIREAWNSKAHIVEIRGNRSQFKRPFRNFKFVG